MVPAEANVAGAVYVVVWSWKNSIKLDWPLKVLPPLTVRLLRVVPVAEPVMA